MCSVCGSVQSVSKDDPGLAGFFGSMWGGRDIPPATGTNPVWKNQPSSEWLKSFNTTHSPLV